MKRARKGPSLRDGLRRLKIRPTKVKTMQETRNKYEFDMIGEGLDVDPLMIVFLEMTRLEGQILEYELIGPGGGNERFVVDLPEFCAPKFERWLEECGYDPQVMRVKEEN